MDEKKVKSRSAVLFKDPLFDKKTKKEWRKELIGEGFTVQEASRAVEIAANKFAIRTLWLGNPKGQKNKESNKNDFWFIVGFLPFIIIGFIIFCIWYLSNHPSSTGRDTRDDYEFCDPMTGCW